MESAAPAELKFLVVLAGGIAGSFGITSLVMRIPVISRVLASGPRPPAGPRVEVPLSARPVAR
jgi:hypothetical protein